MIDTLKLIIAGIAGKLDHDSAARKSIWLLASTAFFTICCTVFAAYVSFSRYQEVAGFLPGSWIAAIAITIGISGFILFASGYISTFSAERVLNGVSSLPIVSVMLVFIGAVAVGIMDYQMNLDGAYDVAKSSAGAVLSVDVDGIRGKYESRIKKLQSEIDHIKDPKNPQYKWKGALIASGRKEVAKLRDQITQIEKRIDQEVSLESGRVERANSERDNREEITHDRLLKAVRAVYIVQFFLCLIMAFLGVYMSDALNGQVRTTPKEPVRVVRTTNKKKKEDKLERIPEPTGQVTPTGFYDGTQIGFTGKQTETQTIPKGKRQKLKKKQTRKIRVPNGQVQGTTIRSDTLETMGKVVAARKALIMSGNESPTQKQIAEVIGMSEKTVGRHLKRIENLNLAIE